MSGLLGRPLTEDERKALLSWQQCDRKILYVRARMVLLAESAPSAAAISRALGVHVQTTRDILRRFNQGGLAAIAPKPKPGRPRQFGQEAAETLIAILHENPVEYGGDDGRWTLALAAKALAAELGVKSISTDTILRLLKSRRYSWQRAKAWITSPDPKYALKKSGVTA